MSARILMLLSFAVLSFMIVGGFQGFSPASYTPNLRVHIKIQDRDFGSFDQVLLDGKDLIDAFSSSTSFDPRDHLMFKLLSLPELSAPHHTLELERSFVTTPSLHSWIKSFATSHQKPFDLQIFWYDLKENDHLAPQKEILTKLTAISSLPLSWSLEVQQNTLAGFQEHIILAVGSIEP